MASGAFLKQFEDRITVVGRHGELMKGDLVGKNKVVASPAGSNVPSNTGTPKNVETPVKSGTPVKSARGPLGDTPSNLHPALAASVPNLQRSASGAVRPPPPPPAAAARLAAKRAAAKRSASNLEKEADGSNRLSGSTDAHSSPTNPARVSFPAPSPVYPSSNYNSDSSDQMWAGAPPPHHWVPGLPVPVAWGAPPPLPPQVQAKAALINAHGALAALAPSAAEQIAQAASKAAKEAMGQLLASDPRFAVMNGLQCTSPEASQKMKRWTHDPVDIFISFRFGEAHTEALALKAELEGRGLTVFLSDVSAGANLQETIARALSTCKLCVILATKTYGRKTNGLFDTSAEMNYVIGQHKDFYLVRMIPFDETWSEPATTMAFPPGIMFQLWLPGEPMPAELPAELVKRISTEARRANMIN